jgi:hypothetical protein
VKVKTIRTFLNNRKHEAGFTFVELATILIIIAALAWLHVMNGFDGADVRNNDYWDDKTSTVSTADSNTGYMAKVEGVAEQTSLDITK